MLRYHVFKSFALLFGHWRRAGYVEVGDGVAHVYGLDNVGANELVEFENGVKGVALNLEESNVGVILLNQVNKVTENMTDGCLSYLAVADNQLALSAAYGHHGVDGFQTRLERLGASTTSAPTNL